MRYSRKNTRWNRNKGRAEGDCGFIELRNNKNKPVAVAVVDREDLIRCLVERKWRLCKTSGNVVSGHKNKRVTTLQRFIAGESAEGFFVCHYDGDPLINKKANLYLAEYPERYN